MTPENFAADIPPELAKADDLLTQYGRWATSYGRSSTPGTLDRMYIREADRKESLEAYQRRRAHVPSESPMPTPDAMNVQRALAKVEAHERIVLTLLYVPNRVPVHVQLRLLKITPEQCRQRHKNGLIRFKGLHDVLSLQRFPVM